MYRSILKDGGQIHFKTDNRPLFDWSLRQFEKNGWELSEVTNDLHADGIQGIMTDYEIKFHTQGVKINRCVATVR
jgi:tRNA (guanine-N7-)-methyltransferase